MKKKKLTKQDVLNLIAASHLESDKQNAKFEHQMSESNAKFEAELKKSNDETAKKFQETALQMKETDRKLSKLSDLYNGFAKNTGEAVEEFFFNYFETHPVIHSITFARVVHQMRSDTAEYDIVLTNGEYVAIIEEKHKFHPNDVVKFAEVMLPKFKTEFPKFAHCKIIAGIASFVFPPDTKSSAAEYGFYIFTQQGENVAVVNTADFMPTFY